MERERYVGPRFWTDMPTDPGRRVLFACERFKQTLGTVPRNERTPISSEFADAFGVLTLLGKRIGFKFEPIPIGVEEALTFINDQFYSLERYAFQYVLRESVGASENKYAAFISEEFVHEFEDSDIEKIQNHLNRMRDIVRETDELDEAHRRRVTSSLESLQRSLNRKMSKLDQFGGVIIEVLAVATKVSLATKPLLIELREVFQLMWKAKRAADGIPENRAIPSLPTGVPSD